ncbi:cation:proton antiporter domain-containing protein [Dyadobacter helix]|uniref:cation:proton antiporter domain-containing protein n=1 Tax=Dyadobacter helix TaxID=2822344 RepID=UPI001BFC7BBE|nr:cation:proton antiporter [Dyadobacter sp. CECT 9275]
MVHQNLLLVLILFFFIALLYLWSERLKISYPILLVLGGLAIPLIPAVPNVSLNPEIIFLIFLPPLLFEAAWTTSWKDFWARKE